MNHLPYLLCGGSLAFPRGAGSFRVAVGARCFRTGGGVGGSGAVGLRGIVGFEAMISGESSSEDDDAELVELNVELVELDDELDETDEELFPDVLLE